MIKKEKVAKNMNQSLMEQANLHNVSIASIQSLFQNEDLNGLDELFGDGGEVRCVHYTDLAMDYGFQFGKIESERFEKARWECFELAMRTFGR